MNFKGKMWALGFAFAVAACSGASQQASTEPVALVKTAAVTLGAIDEKITIYGAAENGSLGKHTLSSPIEAVVRSIDSPVGSNVAKGQVIVRLAPSPTAHVDLANATVTANAANMAYARAQRLRADGLVSDAEVEMARAAKQSTDALRASLAGRSASLTLRSPTSGTVEVIGVSAGELIAPGTVVVTIVKDGDIRARFGIDPALARRVPPGSTIDVTIGGNSVPFTLPVLSVDPVVDPQTKLASVYALIPSGNEIGPGESLTGKILLGNAGSAMTIPYGALLDDGGQPYVYVIEKGVAKRADITVGPRMGDRISVTSGLTASQQVAVDGLTALEDGMKVRTR